MSREEQKQIMLALLFLEGNTGVMVEFVKKVLGLNSQADALTFVDKFAKEFNKQSLGLKVKRNNNVVKLEIESGIQERVKDFFLRERRTLLSSAKTEVLALIAYKQPITMSLINKIRNKKSETIVNWLLDKGFIKVDGKDKYNSKIFKTTNEFCEYFQIKSLEDLPKISLNEFIQIKTEE